MSREGTKKGLMRWGLVLGHKKVVGFLLEGEGDQEGEITLAAMMQLHRARLDNSHINFLSTLKS